MFLICFKYILEEIQIYFRVDVSAGPFEPFGQLGEP